MKDDECESAGRESMPNSSRRVSDGTYRIIEKMNKSFVLRHDASEV
jgi:hypothetical protein